MVLQFTLRYFQSTEPDACLINHLSTSFCSNLELWESHCALVRCADYSATQMHAVNLDLCLNCITHFLDFFPPPCACQYSPTIARLYPRDIPASAPHNPFLAVLGKSPTLLFACTSNTEQATSTNTGAEIYLGLKTLRLVCHGGRTAASRAITRFKLSLNREPGRDMSGVVQVLEGACVRSLTVEVINKVLLHVGGERVISHEGECVWYGS